MALPCQIEVQTGGDKRLYIGLWLIWLAALVNILLHAPTMPLLLLVLCAVMLLLSVPRSNSPSLKHQHLRLHATGSLNCGELQGRWHSNTWRSPWYTVIRIRTGRQQWWAWISASRNSPEDYRRLGIWCRYSPQQPAESTGSVRSP